MFRPISTLDEEAPIISDEPIVSKASGDDALAQGLTDTASKALEVGANLEEVASKSMLYQSQAQLQNLKDSAKGLLKMNPMQAQTIVQQTQQNAQSLLQNSYLNREDRAQFQKDIADSMGELGDVGVDAQVKSTNALQEVSFLTNLPAFYKSYAANAVQNPDLAQSQAESFHTTLAGMIARGALEPRQAANILKPLNDIQQNAQDLVDNRDNINNAAQYHAAMYSPFAGEPSKLDGTPYNQNQVQGAAIASSDVSFRGLMQKATNPGYQFNSKDTAAMVQLTPDEYQRVKNAHQGAAEAYGDITSNQPWSVISAKYQALLQSKGNLNDAERAQLGYYSNYIKGLQNGSYRELMSNTAAGANIVNDTNTRLQSVMQNPTLDDDEKQDWSNTILNDSITKFGNLGHGMPSQLVQPIPQQILQPITSAFQLGGDPQAAVNSINKLTTYNQGYLRNSLPPAQAAIAQTIGLMGSQVDPKFSQDLITYNQKGYSFANIKKDSPNSDKSLNIKINSDPQMQTINQFLRLQDNGTAIANALPGTLQSYVKGVSQTNGDTTLDHADDVMNTAISNVKQAYDIATGTNYMFNRTQLPLTSDDYDRLAQYGIDQSKQAMMARGFSKSQVENLNFTVTNTPDDYIKVMTSDGTEVGRFPYDSKLMDHIDASASQKKQSFLKTTAVSALGSIP